MKNHPHTLSSADEMRVFVGLLVQPFLAAVLAFFSFPLVERTGRELYGGVPADATDAAISLAIGVGIVAFLVVLLGALPAVLWLLQRGPVTLKQALLFRVALANIPVVLGTALSGACHTRSSASCPRTFVGWGSCRPTTGRHSRSPGSSAMPMQGERTRSPLTSPGG